MENAQIKFEREGVDGLVAVGTLLSDAVKRFGIKIECEGTSQDRAHTCAVLVSEGSDHLSPLSETEAEHFAQHGRRPNERLACEARIVSPGEITIMTDEKKEETSGAGYSANRIKEEFEALPLDKKIGSLLQMEAATISEAFTYVVNSSAKAFEKAGSAIEEFGSKFEQEARKAGEGTEPKAGEGSAKKPNGRPKTSSDAEAAI